VAAEITDVEVAHGGVPILPLEEDRQPPPPEGMEGMGYDDAVTGNPMVVLRGMRGPSMRSAIGVASAT
jgi:hypothetical protein